MADPFRVVHLDPDMFDDADVEAAVFEDAFGAVTVEPVRDADDVAGVGRADVIATGGAPVSAELLDATEPAVVAVYATGVDHVDVAAATERGVAVTRVPTYCDREVAEHAIALALALLRGLPRYEAETAEGGWDWRVADPLYTWDELTVGLLAFGRKAQGVAERAAALGFDVVAHDPYLDAAEIREAGAEPVGFEELLAGADVLSVHAPLTPETEGMLDAAALDRLPEGAVLVNTSRGAVVDEDALLAALEDGSLAGAGLDVLAEEPPDPDNPLLDRDDVIVTPHAAWNSEGAEERLRRRGSEIAVAACRGGAVDGVVNPEVLEGRGG